MTALSNIQWAEVERLNQEQKKLEVFRIIQAASRAIQERDLDDHELLEIVPRIVGLCERAGEELSEFSEPVSALARATGLWNYIDHEVADASDAVVAETARSELLEDITFHREQVIALNSLLSGNNLILSAPTSFGKSVLIDALLASGNYQRVAIVLPTIALLDEFRRRLKSRFRDHFSIIMHHSESASDAPTIFLGTQERLISRDDLDQLDLTVVDEFYKLDPARKDERSVTLNAAVHLLLKISKQFFFLGPNIDGVNIVAGSRWKFEFFRTRFSTVAVDTIDLTKVKNKKKRLFREISNPANWPALVFVSSPTKANQLAEDLFSEIALKHDASEFADWLQKNIGSRFPLANFVRSGVGLHHGRLPRSVTAQMVWHFDTGKLPILICTSTLIEGVNTSAKTVMIFDKKINNKNYDFFTFSNIRGRAGRLGQHHVGKVLLFNEEPEREELEVSPTLFDDQNAQSNEYLVHIEPEDRAADINDRIAFIQARLGLDDKDLKIASTIGIENSFKLKKLVSEFVDEGRDVLWSGFPDYGQIETLMEIICEVRSPFYLGARSYRQLTFFIAKFREAGSMKAFLNWYDGNYDGEDKEYDNIFKFLRACEYGIPQFLAVIEMFAKQKSLNVDYGLLTSGLSQWFCPELLKNLEEEGIPIQLTERFYVDDMFKEALILRLSEELKSSKSELTKFEKNWLTYALEAQ